MSWSQENWKTSRSLNNIHNPPPSNARADADAKGAEAEEPSPAMQTSRPSHQRQRQFSWNGEPAETSPGISDNGESQQQRDLELQNKKTEREKTALEAANEDLYDKVEKEQGLREATEQQLAKALNEKKTLEDAAATDAAELAQLRQEVEELKKTIEGGEKAAKDRAENLKHVEDGYGELQEALRTALDDHEEVKKQLKAQQEQNDELVAQRAGVDQLLHDAEQENLRLQNVEAERDEARENLQQLEEMFAAEFKVHSEGLDFDAYLRTLAEAVHNGTRLRREESQTSLRSEDSQDYFGEPSRARRPTARGNKRQVSTNSLGDELAAMEGGEESEGESADELYADGEDTLHAGHGNLIKSAFVEKKGRMTHPSEPTNNDSYPGTATYHQVDEHNVVPGTAPQVPKDWSQPESTIKVPATAPISIAPTPAPPANYSEVMAENKNLRARLASMQGTLDLRQKDREAAVKNAHVISQKAEALRKEVQDLKDEIDRLKKAPLKEEAVASRDIQLRNQAEQLKNQAEKLKQQHDWLLQSNQRTQNLEGELKVWKDSWHEETQKAMHVIGLKDEEIQQLSGMLNRPRAEKSTQTDPEPTVVISTSSTGVQTDESRSSALESVHHATQTDSRPTAPSYVSTGTVTAALPVAQPPPSSHAGVQTTESWPVPVVEIVRDAPGPAAQQTPWWVLVLVGVAGLLLAWMLGLGGGAGRWESMNDVSKMGVRVRTSGSGWRTPWEGAVWGWICAVLGVEGSLVG